MNNCLKCGKEIDLGEMGIHETREVTCENCDTRLQVTMHGNGALFEEVKESPIKQESPMQQKSPVTQGDSIRKEAPRTGIFKRR